MPYPKAVLSFSDSSLAGGVKMLFSLLITDSSRRSGGIQEMMLGEVSYLIIDL